MSVGDVRGFRRRLALAEARGHMPARVHRTVAESVAHERALAAKAAQGKPKKGKK